MVVFVLILGVVNLALGGALAVLHDRLLRDGPRATVTSVAAPAAPVDPPAPITITHPVSVAPTATTEPGGMPERWRAIIDAFSLRDLDPVETSLWVCVRQCEEVRQQLTRADGLQRGNNGEQAIPQYDFGSTLRVCREWCEDLREAFRQVTGIRTAEFSSGRLDELFVDYAREIEADLAALSERDATASARMPGRRRELLNRLLDTAYRLRDELHERLAIHLQSHGRVTEIAAHLRVDPEMAVYNRIGLEHLVESCRGSDEKNTTSLALIDIDRFRRIQQELGAAQADSFLAVFAELAEHALRANRGFDRAARVSGHSFVFFLGSTPLDGAEVVCERLRQQVEAASFVIGGRELEITVSCSAVELQPNEHTGDALKRLRAALVESHKAGRNRTCLDNGQQRTIVQPQQMQVTGQRIEVSYQPSAT